MTRLSSAFLLRRAWEQATASAAALAVTAAFLLTMNAHAGNRTLTPSVTMLVPTVEIEVVDDNSQPVTAGRVTE